MGMPRVLKNYNLFNDGNSYMGQVEEVTLPKLARKTEDYRGGGMPAPVKLDIGQEPLELESKFAGFMSDVLRQYGILNIAGVGMRFVGAYQADDSAIPYAVEVIVRGRHTEIDMGKAKAGDKTEFTVKTALTYYKLVVNGETLIEIDLLNMIEKVGGSDRYALIRGILGIF